ncbi:MAG TPA: FecR domain-containing protein [Puia sp.]|nr:FecR domain-containing protein [Puia sp.]
MPEFTHRASELLVKHLQNTLTDQERAELMDWVNQSPENLQLFKDVADLETLMPELTSVTASKEKVLDKLRSLIPEVNATKSARVYQFLRRYAVPVAAAVILFLGSAVLFLVQHKKTNLSISATSRAILNDVPAPTGARTILTLANGSTIVLDSVQNGNLARLGNVNVSKRNGQLAYNTSGSGNEKPNSSEIMMNTLFTAKGGQTMIVLADGSKVWLNAASSIRFPTVFKGPARKVELTGEAYFEIATNKAVPFVVTANEMQIEVLGTHFNVMAYQDEHSIKTTLLEGAVKVSKGTQSALLHPGQQAQVTSGAAINVLSDIDTDQAVAWKNGAFQFDKADIASVMRQLQRWYDIEVVFADKPDIHLVGTISKNVNISNVLKMMELNGAHFRIEGKKITVLK